MNKFRKVSFEEYKKTKGKNEILTQYMPKVIEEYNDIKVPQRATKGSAGYDFYSPISFTLDVGQTIKIPTGIRIELDTDKFLMIVPKSGLGFKFRLQLDNTLGIVDSDYFYSDNEGHIFVKITNDGNEGKSVVINKGDSFAQGIILSYGVTVDDDADGIRNGGFGSTSGK